MICMIKKNSRKKRRRQKQNHNKNSSSKKTKIMTLFTYTLASISPCVSSVWSINLKIKKKLNNHKNHKKTAEPLFSTNPMDISLLLFFSIHKCSSQSDQHSTVEHSSLSHFVDFDVSVCFFVHFYSCSASSAFERPPIFLSFFRLFIPVRGAPIDDSCFLIACAPSHINAEREKLINYIGDKFHCCNNII